jgi:hypothetical protein
MIEQDAHPSDTKTCPHCAETIRAEAKVCRYCGRELEVKPTAKEKRASLTKFLVIFGVLLLFGAFSARNDSNSPSRSTASGNAASSRPTPEPKPISVYSYIVGHVEGMTDAQRNTYLGSLVGGRATLWEGTVCNVTETFGNYAVEVSIDESNDDSSCNYEARWSLSERAALGYEIGERVTFGGIVESVNETAGQISFHFEDVRVNR